MAIYYGSNTAAVAVNAIKEKPVYVEVPEGSTIDDMSSSNTIAISPSEYEELQNAVNYRTQTFNEKTLSQMIAALKEKYQVHTEMTIRVGEEFSTSWTRPQDWPDLDSLNLQMSGETDIIYMTYDTRKTMNNIALYITGSNISVYIGHINNGIFSEIEQISATNTNYYYKSLNEYYNNGYNYVVVRVMGTITGCRLTSYTINGRTQSTKQSPLIERLGYIPHLTLLSNGDSNNWASYFLQRDKLNNGNGNALTSMAYAYSRDHALVSLDLNGLDTHNVTSLQHAFSYCVKLSGVLDLRHFNVEKVTNFASMFYECRSITGLNLTGWTTTALTGGGISSTFYGCVSLKYIYGIENFNISNCNTLYQTFSNCRNLRELDLNLWNTDKIRNLYCTFNSCHSIKDLSFISKWSIHDITNLQSAFSGCRNIEKLDLHTWDVSQVTNCGGLFSSCFSLKQLNIDGWQMNSTNLSYVFYNCFCLEHINISGWHVTNTCTTIYYMFGYCTSLQELDIPNDWNLSGITTGSALAYAFTNCWSLKRITGISNWNFPAQSLTNFFSACYSLKTLDVSGWDVSKITNLGSIFNNCMSLETLDISNWDTSSCTNFSSMFTSCYTLKNLNVSNFNLSKATTTYNMFSNCVSLVSIGDISNWDVSNVTTFESMFSGCYSLLNLSDLSNWATKVTKITTTANMFYSCYSLQELTLNNWNLTACTSITTMFQYCYNLKTLNLNNWCANSPNQLLPKLTTNPGNLFHSCYNLTNFTGLKLQLSHSYLYCYGLSQESISAILTNLPTVASTKTITIPSVINAQLTSEEKQAVTNKGWTISVSS